MTYSKPHFIQAAGSIPHYMVEKISMETKSGINRVRAIAIGLIVLGGAFLSMPGLAQAKDDGMAIAMSQDIPGKNNIDGRGGEYVSELYRRFIQAGGEAYLVKFEWRRFSQKRAEQNLIDGIAVFRDAEGRYWAMGMYTTHPVWVPGTDPQKWVDRMYPNLTTRVLATATETKFAGRYSDRSRVAVAIVPGEVTGFVQ